MLSDYTTQTPPPAAGSSINQIIMNVKLQLDKELRFKTPLSLVLETYGVIQLVVFIITQPNCILLYTLHIQYCITKNSHVFFF